MGGSLQDGTSEEERLRAAQLDAWAAAMKTSMQKLAERVGKDAVRSLLMAVLLRNEASIRANPEASPAALRLIEEYHAARREGPAA